MKAKFWVMLLLCSLLGFPGGCGVRESDGAWVPGDGEMQESRGAGGAEIPENGAVQESGAQAGSGTPEAAGERPALRRMELLQFEDPDNENLADLLQRAGGGMMVQLRAGNLLGSGVICGVEEDKLLILTAAHVLAEAQGDVLVTFISGESVSARDFVCFASGDFALVRVAEAGLSKESLEQCLYANVDKECFDAAAAGAGCIVMGSGSGVAAQAYEGSILDTWIYMEDYGQYMMWVRAEGSPGMSGGGLFDREGHFLGILSGESEDGELAVVPLSLILAQVEPAR